MRNALIALAGWSAFAIYVVLFGMPLDSVSASYWSDGLLPCMRLVGRSPECEAAQAVINDAWWRFHLLPIYLAVVGGYVAVVVVWILGRGRRVTRQGSGSASRLPLRNHDPAERFS